MEQKRTKLPIKTKVAAWLLIIMAVIVFLLFFGFACAAGSSGNEDISMFAPLIAIMGFGIAIWYFIPGILLLKTRNRWVWILSVAILCAGVLVPFVLLLRDIFDFISWGLPPKYLSVESNYIYFFISFLIPLILVLLDKLSYKIVVFIPVSFLIIFLVCFYSVRSDAGSYNDQATAFDTRMYTELHDLYGQAVEDRNVKGCQGCEEVNQYFNEEWNQLDPDVEKQSDFDITNNLRHRYCLEAIAYLTENISICEYVAEIDGSEGPGSAGEQCKKAVQALLADNVSLCSDGYECTAIFAIMTDNSSLCDQLPYYYVNSCYARCDLAKGDSYNYLGLNWQPP